jgi:predicted HD superfamily hydrolase involved in NAD metabolism
MLSIEEGIRQYITEHRFLHTAGVRDTAISLARHYGCSEEKASVAALLHDVARDLPLPRMQRIVEKDSGGSICADIVFNSPGLLHARAGKIIAQREFGVQDEDILRSIELHTTGGAGMSLLNKVIFVADYTEPGREFRGAEKARKLSKRDIDVAVLYIFKSMLFNLLRSELFICEETLFGYNEYILHSRKGDNVHVQRSNVSRPNS